MKDYRSVECPFCQAHPTEDCIDMRGGGGGMAEYGQGNGYWHGQPGHPRRIKSVHAERKMKLEDGLTLIEIVVIVLIFAIFVAIGVQVLDKADPTEDGPPDGSGWTEVPSPDDQSTHYQRSYVDGAGRDCVDRYAKTAQGVSINTDCGDRPANGR